MAEATRDEIRTGQGTRLDDLADEQIDFWLAKAKLKVIDDGVEVSHPRFAELQTYLVYDYLESTGSIPNEVNSEAVGDVSIGFDTNIAIGSAIFWNPRYKKTLEEVRGFNHIIC